MKYDISGHLIIETLSELRNEVLNTNYHDIDETPSKHDCHYKTIVFPWDGKNWMCHYEVSYQGGIQFWSKITCYEVEEKEVVVKKWAVVERIKDET